MPIQPFIFVGVGGTGGKTLGVIRKTLGDVLSRVGWTEGWPDGWQFVHIDVPADPDADTGGTPYDLPRTTYVPLTTATSTYQGFHDAITQELRRAEADPTTRYLAWGSWHPEPASAVKVEIRNGAGQYRTLGRVCALKSLRIVDQRLTRAYDEATSATAGPQLRRVQELIGRDDPTSGEVRPVIFVVGSTSGGSGSGMFLDVVDVLRAQGHREINAVLFTPEVFEKPSGALEPGVAPNTFVALCEIANSMWTHAQADAPLSRDRMFARAGVSYPVGHGGPSTVFLVGRRNRSVTFDNAGDVYKIVGRSLGELALDEKLTTAVVNYDIANGNAIAAGARDMLNLSVPDGARDVAPFRGLGFSRLTVGRDFFDRYATDRLRRRVGLRLLNGHLERRQRNDVRSDDEIKQDIVDEVWPAFLRDAGLDEVREADAISNALFTWDHAEMLEARTTFLARVRQGVTATNKRKVVDAEARSAALKVVQNALGGRSDFRTRSLNATNDLAVRLQYWLQENLQGLILHHVALHGLPVATELVARLIDRCHEGVTSLRAERSYVDGKLAEMLQALPQTPPGAPAEFPVGSVDDVERIGSEALAIMRRHVQSVSKQTAEEFLDDLTTNLLGPWHRALIDADGLLRMELQPKVGDSPLELWPGDLGIPEYLRPSKVEYLLDELDGFPEQFIEVIERSVSGTKGLSAVITATEQVITGAALGVHSKATPVVQIDQAWVPAPEIARAAGQERTTARIKLALELGDITARTHDWLVDQEKYVGQFLRQSMADYLTDPLTDAPELKRRQAHIVGMFEAMIKSSLPLVALDPRMTNLIHGHDVPPYNLHVSELNVPSELTELRQKLQDASVALLKTPQAIRFTNTPRDDAMMMTLLAEPYHMLEVASIMTPVSKQWSQGGEGRDMWLYRRARPLGEWVPLGPDARRALITGWFAARLLGDATAEGSAGTELAVTVDGRRLTVPRAGVRPPSTRDQIGMLMEALPAAFLDCYNHKSLDGIEVYQHLIALGASIDDEINVVTKWVAGDGGRANTRVEKSITEGLSRQEAATAQLDAWSSTYAAVPGRLADTAAAQLHSMYEVYGDVLDALRTIRAAVNRTADESEW